MIRVESKRWRSVNGEQKRRIKWKMMRDSEKKEEYKKSTRGIWKGRIERGASEGSRRNDMVKVMTEAAEECVD